MSGLLKLLNACKGGFTIEYRNILTRANALGYSLPGALLQEKGNALIVELKQQDQWDKLIFLYVLYCDTEDFTLIEWKTPSRAVLTKLAPVAFTPNGGWRSNGAGELQGDTANNFFGTGVREVTSGAMFRWNNITGSPFGFTGPIFTTNFTSATASSPFSWSGAPDAVVGFNLGAFGTSVIKHYALRRVGGTVTPYMDGAALTNIARAAVATNGSLRICSRGGGNHFNEQVRIVYAGLNTLDVSVLQTAFTNYMS